ncbi:GrpB family protein [Xylophilus sp. GW821-FHT01B05]
MTERESLQRAIHEDVALLPHDPCWPALFEAERARLARLFPSQLRAIEHIGSTAIAGMPAKPVIDILAGVETMAAADALAAPLFEANYTTSPAFNATLADRRWWMRWANGHRTHHLHLVVLDSLEWQQRLRFRDALRADAALAQRYARLKAALAQQHQTDREAYTEAKSAFVRAVLAGPGATNTAHSP